MPAELKEIGQYMGYLRRVQTISPDDLEGIEDVVHLMFDSRQINQISKEMHDYLCYLLAERTCPQEN